MFTFDFVKDHLELAEVQSTLPNKVNCTDIRYKLFKFQRSQFDFVNG
jgi:hypothetical protein